jgi:EF hand
MRRQVLVITTSAFILAYGVTAATAQGPMQPDQHHPQQATPGRESTGPGGMMGRGMMGGGMMGRGMMGGGMMMGPPIMMRMIFALMDADGDGTISLQEFQAAHERIFKAMDTNKDGRLTRKRCKRSCKGAGGHRRGSPCPTPHPLSVRQARQSRRRHSPAC